MGHDPTPNHTWKQGIAYNVFAITLFWVWLSMY